jgi:hypothetical protein
LFSKIGMRMAIYLYEIAFEYEYNCKYCSAKFFLAKFAFNLYEFIGQDSWVEKVSQSPEKKDESFNFQQNFSLDWILVPVPSTKGDEFSRKKNTKLLPKP